MGRRTTILLAAALLASPLIGRVVAPPASPPSPPAFPVRMVKLSGDPAKPATLDHVKYCRELGFNALWVYSNEIGAWTKQRAPRHVIVDPAFLRLTRWCRRNGLDVWVSINPQSDARGRFVFTDAESERRLLEFIGILRKKAGVTRFVISFDDQPRELTDLADIFRYGASTAPAQLDLVARVAAALPPDVELWFCGAAYCDAHLGDGTGPYAKALLAALPQLPPKIGIVWTGPQVLSRAITRADLVATRERLGGRPLLLYDNFPVNDNEQDDAMALILGALKNREPGIRDVVAAYLASPELPLAASRLTLSTTAEFLADPGAYDPDAAAKRAVAKLAGPDPEAARALGIQQIEWGGFIGELNYWPRELANPEAAGRALHDPAFVESFTWTASRYPERMAAISRSVDVPFRTELLRMMTRRLAIARVIPLAVEFRARVRAGRPDAAETLALIEVQRRSWEGNADARMILDRFLAAAEVPVAGSER